MSFRLFDSGRNAVAPGSAENTVAVTASTT